MASTAAPSPPSLSPRPDPAACRHRARLGDSNELEGEVAVGGFPACWAHGCDSPIRRSAFGSWDTGRCDHRAAARPQARRSRGCCRTAATCSGPSRRWSRRASSSRAILGMCSFAPGGPGPGPAPDYDAPAALQADADALRIPIRVPALPEGWRANSGSRAGIDARPDGPVRASRRARCPRPSAISTPTGMYLALTQSNADEEKLVGSIDSDMVPTGTAGCRRRAVGGLRRRRRGAEPVWTTRLNGPTGPAQIAIRGAGGTDEYRTLAAAVQKQPPLPRSRTPRPSRRRMETA